MPKKKISAQTSRQIPVLLYEKLISDLDDSVIPLLRLSGRKIQRSEVVRVLLEMVIDAVPCIDRKAIAEGDDLKEVIIEGIVKASKKSKR